MSLSQNPISANLFIDYIPAELKENKVWMIEYYVKNPRTNKLVRKQNRVRPLKKIADKRKLAKQMIKNINQKLESGWNPYISDNVSNGFAKFNDVAKIYLKNIKIKVKKNDLRDDTLRSYKSFLSVISSYLQSMNNEDMFIFDFNNKFVSDYLEYIYYDRDNTARTRNNHLAFIITFAEWLIQKKYLTVNPTNRLEKLTENKKIRVLFPNKIKNEIFNYLDKNNRNYKLLCEVSYYCLIRRTELTKLKVRDVFLNNSIIYVDSANSKNKKSKPVTIPDILLSKLARYLRKANNSDYLFGNNFMPNKIQLKPKKISDEFTKVRDALNLPNIYQWYSFKETGITNLLRIGIPAIDVRDQARHHSIQQTEAYTPKEILKAVDSIKNANI